MATRIEVFQYPASDHPPMLAEDLWGIRVEPDIGEANYFDEQGTGDGSMSKPISAAAKEATRCAFEAGREQGVSEGRAAAVAEHATLLQEAESKHMNQAARLADEFIVERDKFLQAAEQEVVKLALAIAARILRREAQIDPLFLVGAVRVALGQLAATMQVKLHVPADEAELWVETMAHLPNLKTIPSVIAEDRMRLGDCRIETEMGSVDLGLSAQLREAERALFRGAHTDVPDKSADRGAGDDEEHK